MSDDVQDVVSELKGEVKSLIRGRLANPFLGAFLVAWLAWNHRLFFVLFSSNSLEYRFKYVDDKLYPDVWSFSYMNFLGPLLSCAVIIFLIPWAVEAVHRWNLKMRRRLRAAELRSENRNPLSEEQSAQMRDALLERDRLIDDQRAAARKDTQKLARYSAMVSVLSSSLESEEAVKRFLLSGSLRLHSNFHGAESTYRFDNAGKVSRVVEAAGALGGVASWKLAGLNLSLLDNEDELIATMAFNAHKGLFEERSGLERKLGI
ncbi:hypothetical protein C1750_14640 [Stenotrophomonas pavanii]|nr:hypothetical protein C1750_14640 [Stenotrophomonas pavanii]